MGPLLGHSPKGLMPFFKHREILELASLTCLPVRDTQCPLSQLLGQAIVLFHVWGPRKAHPDLLTTPSHTCVGKRSSQGPGSPPYPSLSRAGKAGMGRAGQGEAGHRVGGVPAELFVLGVFFINWFSTQKVWWPRARSQLQAFVSSGASP